MQYKKYAHAVKKIYKKLNKHIKQYAKITNLKCYKQCGSCCENPKIETTVLEFLPLAIELWKKNKAEFWLNKLNQDNHNKRCILYQPDINIPDNGRCALYPFRALICRLFNFSGMVNKNQQIELIICEKIKNKNPELIEKINSIPTNKLPIPIMRDYSFQIYNINQDIGAQYYPINEALKRALEITGFNPKKVFKKH